MLFNDYVRNLEGQNEELKKLEGIMIELNEILELEKCWKNQSFKYGYLGLIDNTRSSSPVSNSNKLSSDTVKYFHNLREKLIGIDFLEFGEILGEIKLLGNELLNAETNDLVETLKESYKIIHNYKKCIIENDRVDKYCECMDSIRLIIDTLNKFEFMYKYMNSINTELCNGIKEDGLEIQLLNHGITKDTYPHVVDSVCVIYEKLCEITNVKEEIIIARVETGSLFAKFLGNKNILKLVAKVLNASHDIFVREYTREGQKKNLVESTELFKQQFDIVKEMESMGMDVSELKEISNETMVLIMKKSNLLLLTSSDIRINEKTLSKSEDVKKLLEKNEYKLLSVAEETD